MRKLACPYTDPAPLFRHGGAPHAERGTVLDFSVNVNPLGPPPSVLEALRRELPAIGRYPDPECRLLTERLATHHGVAPAQVVVGNGSNELIHAVARISPIRKKVILEPTYSEYLRASLEFGTPEHWLGEGDNYRWDPFALPPISLVWLCNPNNPTGQLWQREQLTGWIAAHPQTLFVVDEAFLPFVEAEAEHSLVPLLPQLNNAVVLRSLTKYYGLPGLRLGYAVTTPGLAERLRKQLPTWSVNALAQVAGRAALDDPDFSRQTQAWLPAAREVLLRQLRGVPGLCPLPSRANFILIRMQGAKANEVVPRLAGRGIVVRDASNFVGLDGRFIRVAVRGLEDNQRLVDDLRLLFWREE